MQENETYCVFEPITFHRFLLIIALGTPISVVGSIANFILILIFLQQKYRSLPTLYLGVLAMFDLQLCLGYIVLCTCDAIALYYRNLALWKLWHDCSMTVFTMARIGQLASTYLVVFATFERFLLVGEYDQLSWIYNNRGMAQGGFGT